MLRVPRPLHVTFIAILVIFMISSMLEISASASNFAIGDLVEVQNTGSIGLKVRNAPAGNWDGSSVEYDGARGIIRDGPQIASLGGVTYTWWKIQWKDGKLGWSAEGYPGGVYYIKKVPPEAPTALSPGSSSGPGPIIDTLTPTLQWQGSFGADYYALAISEYPYGSSNIVYNPQQIYGTSYTVPSGVLQPGKKYRWNLQAHSSGGWSPISDTLYFQTPDQGKPDLTVIGQVSFTPSSAVRGQSLSVQFTVKNAGSSSSGSFYVRVSLATTAYGTDYSLGNFQVSSLSAGESRALSITTNPIPSSVPAGSYYVTAFVDGFKEIDESDEYNNIGSSTPNKVEVQNQRPTCSISANPRSGKAPLEVTFSMSASDPDGSISAWVLDVNGDGKADYSGYGNPPSTLKHTYTSEGSYSVVLMIGDNDGASAVATETVNVGANKPPTCSLSPDRTSGEAPLTVTFTISASDPEGSISRWEFLISKDNTKVYQDSGNGNPPSKLTFTFIDPGTYLVILNVYDNDGATSSCTCTIDVRPPSTTYDYTILVSGLGSGYSTKVYLDGVQKTTLSNGQSYKFSGLTGTHTISVDSVVDDGTGIRYVCGSSSITVSGSGSYTFSYKTQYYVTIGVSPPGSGTVSPGSNWYDAESTISISASPSLGYKIKSWSISGSITITNPDSPSTTAKINSPGSITANFEKVEQFAVVMVDHSLSNNVIVGYVDSVKQYPDHLEASITIENTRDFWTKIVKKEIGCEIIPDQSSLYAQLGYLGPYKKAKFMVRYYKDKAMAYFSADPTLEGGKGAPALNLLQIIAYAAPAGGLIKVKSVEEILSAISEIDALSKAFDYFNERRYFKSALELAKIPFSDEVTQLKMAELMRKCGIFVTKEELKQIFALQKIYSIMKQVIDQIWTFTLENPSGSIFFQARIFSPETPPPPDTTPPSLTITSPQEGAQFTSPIIKVRGIASDAGLGDSGISKVEVNGVRASGDTARGNGVANWERSITLNPGYNKIIVEAFDDSPSKNSILKIITVKYNPPDTTGPDVKLIKPQNLSVIPGNIIEFEATASDPSGVDCVIFCIQSPSLGNNPDWSGPIEGFYYYVDETPPYSGIYNWAHLGDGTYGIGILAKDKVGNWANPVAAIIGKKTTAPVAHMGVQPTAYSDAIEAGKSKTQTFTVSASGGTVKGVTVAKVSGPDWITVSPTSLGDISAGSSKTFTITASPPTDTTGSFSYSVRVTCTEGEPKSIDISGTITVTLPPNKPPYTPSNPSPKDGSTNLPTSLTLSWTGGDPDGDKVTYEVYLGTTPTPPLYSSTVETSLHVKGLEGGKTYYWRVVAKDDKGAKTEGPLWRFTTATAPPPPHPSKPDLTVMVVMTSEIMIIDRQPQPNLRLPLAIVEKNVGGADAGMHTDRFTIEGVWLPSVMGERRHSLRAGESSPLPLPPLPQLPPLPPGEYKIKITVALDVFNEVEESNEQNNVWEGVITIVVPPPPPPSPSLTVVSPNGGETWPVGSTQTIRWKAEGVMGNVRIDLSRDGGSTWTTIIPSTPNDGSESWIVTGPATTQARIRIVSLANPAVWDVSDGDFAITAMSITVASPNGGEVWLIGSTQTIKWEFKPAGPTPITTYVKIDLSRDGGKTWETIIPNTINDGGEPWTVTGPPTEKALIRVTSLERPEASDTSDRAFTIVLKGDMNRNHGLDTADATIILRKVVGLEPTSPEDVLIGDMNGSGSLDSGDATAILRKVVGLE